MSNRNVGKGTTHQTPPPIGNKHPPTRHTHTIIAFSAFCWVLCCAAYMPRRHTTSPDQLHEERLHLCWPLKMHHHHHSFSSWFQFPHQTPNAKPSLRGFFSRILKNVQPASTNTHTHLSPVIFLSTDAAELAILLCLFVLLISPNLFISHC